jgi:hypothetical protein
MLPSRIHVTSKPDVKLKMSSTKVKTGYQKKLKTNQQKLITTVSDV